MKRRKVIKKAAAMLLAFAIVLSSFPLGVLMGTTEKADATMRGRLGMENLSGYRFTNSRYMQIFTADYQNQTIYKGSATEAGMMMKRYLVDDTLVFCMEHGVVQKSMTLKATDYRKSSFYAAYNNAGKGYAVRNMYRVLMYGPVSGSSITELNQLGFSDSKYYGKNSRSYTLSDWIAATQMLIWESQQLMRNKNFDKVVNGMFYQDSWRGNKTDPIEKNHYANQIAGTAAIDIYNFMAGKIKEKISFDTSIASADQSKPKTLTAAATGELPYTLTIKGGSKAGAVTVTDEKGKKIKGLQVNFDQSRREYKLVIFDESVWNKTIVVRHDDSAAQRAEKYLKKNNEKYSRYFWEYETADSHTQGMISGLTDPDAGYLKLVKGKENNELSEERCHPDDPDVFPTLYFPIEKIDANPGFDNDSHTPMGDAKLNAVYTLERKIGKNSWEKIDQIQMDELGKQEVFSDQPFQTAEDLLAYRTESGSLTGCAHPITDSEGNIIGYRHISPKTPTKREWDAVVQYRITETRPEGRYIDPDTWQGEREYSFSYKAETHDTCSYCLDCDSLPWTAITYDFRWKTEKGEGTEYTTGETETPEDELNYDNEIFVNDCFRGNLQIIKSNEKENPFKDSLAGGADSNISMDSRWTVKLQSKGFENEEYVHLVSGKPEVLTGGTHQYTVSRDKGATICNSENPLIPGTNGTLILKDLPFGTYIVTEVKADDPMYVLEEFTVTIDEHNGNNGPVNGQGSFSGYDKTGISPSGGSASGSGDYWNNRYDVNIRDKIKENKVKIVKTDSETGKKIPLEGTKIFLRYKGNPDYTDTENREKYGPSGTEAKNTYNRFLPNAESINSKSQNYVFKLDENGIFSIPYRLPYGRYEVLEWLLPEGYYVGAYGTDGIARSHNFGLVEEGQLAVKSPKDGFDGTVADYGIYDKDGKKVVYQDKEKYSFDQLKDMVTNQYTFEVTKQTLHKDGNYTQLVTFDRKRQNADASYDKGEYPYIDYYLISAIPNNAVKGKIEVEKIGEVLTGFQKTEKEGYTIFEPVFEMISSLKDTVFGIFAAEDIQLRDGSEGPEIYDSLTDEKILLQQEKRTHLSNIWENIKAFADKLLHPKEYTGAKYEISTFSHASGAQLWSILERETSETNEKRTLYISPEQKDTKMTGSWQTSEGNLDYRWDVEVTMKNQADGKNITDVNLTKTTSVHAGAEDHLTLTAMKGYVGETELDPIRNYMPISDPTNWKESSALEAYEHTYWYEADGKCTEYADGTKYKDDRFTFEDHTKVDLSQYSAERYLIKDYDLYLLTADDMKQEERKTGEKQVLISEGVDADGDGKYDGPEDIAPVYKNVDVMDTKTAFEWEHNVTLKEGLHAGDCAVMIREDETCAVAVKGCYTAGTYTEYEKPFRWINSDEDGSPEKEYRVPEGWTQKALSGDRREDPQYVVIFRKDEADGQTQYKVLLQDGRTWQKCSAEGNFVQAAVQVYQVRYTQAADDENGILIDMDGITVQAGNDHKDGAVRTIIDGPEDFLHTAVKEVGQGYRWYEENGSLVFETTSETAPVYFLWKDGIRAEMSYKGNSCYAVVTVPDDAVDYLGKQIVPILNFVHYDSENKKVPKILDWYSALTPENPVKEFGSREGLSDGVSVKATRHEKAESGAKTWYTIEISTNQEENAPLEMTFADGYTMAVYCAQTASGNGVGVIELYNVYKTTRYPVSSLVETITTGSDGKAVSRSLPLGTYIIRELDTENGYVNDGSERMVTLSYKDQFTPLVWKAAKFKNSFMKVQLDLKKVFETGWQTGIYEAAHAGQEAVFGIYTAEEISAKGKGIIHVTEKTAAEDTLVGVLKIGCGSDGIPFTTGTGVKLPEGTYYLKEIKAPAGYQLGSVKYLFHVGEEKQNRSEACTFDMKTPDGIYGSLRMTEKDIVKTEIIIENREPMPPITVNSILYNLDKDTDDEEKGVAVDVSDAFSKVTIETKSDTQTEVILPNGRKLTIIPAESHFSYRIDEESFTWMPTISYTGYYAAYEEVWEGIAQDEVKTFLEESSREADTEPEVPEQNALNRRTSVSMTGAGSDKEKLIVKAEITHSIEKSKLQKQYESSGLPSQDIIRQMEEHKAVITAEKEASAIVLPGSHVYKEGKTSEIRTVTEEQRIEITAGQTAIFTAECGAKVKVAMNENGNLSMEIQHVLEGSFEEEKESEVKSDRNSLEKIKEHFQFAKNVTFARQDTSAETLMIKINSDNEEALAVKNDRKPPENPPYKPTEPENPSPAPAIKTSASGKISGNHVIAPEKKAVIVDTVSYENLMIGQKYHLKGILMDKTTGKPLLKSGETVSAEIRFIPESVSGTVEVIFTFDASELGDRELVVFEKLFIQKKESDGETSEHLIASHEDLQDQAQTVYVREQEPEEPEQPEKPHHPQTAKKPVNPDRPSKTPGETVPPNVPKTSDETNPVLYILLLAASVCMLTKLCCTYKKK